MTWEYRGLQGVTRVRRGYRELQEGGYRGLHGVTRGYNWLQGVTGGDNGLQGVTKNYRDFFLTKRFPDTFSWSILPKNQN